jgi:hypothetical protein
MGSAILSTPIIAPTNLDRHQILRNFCHESVRKGLKAKEPLALTAKNRISLQFVHPAFAKVTSVSVTDALSL